MLLHTPAEASVQRPGCILPGPQQPVAAAKVNGVKSEGQLCTAFDVGWTEEATAELVVLEEEWGIISGDVCPMAPPAVRCPSFACICPASGPHDDLSQSGVAVQTSLSCHME